MFCFLICAAFSSVEVGVSRHFQTLYTNDTESYVVEPLAGQHVFFFVQDTAESVWVTTGESPPVSVTRPYALAVTRSAMVNVSTSSSTSVIVMVVAGNECDDGAFYTAGGQTLALEAERAYWTKEVSRYCVFSPSTDNQTVNLEIGLRDMSEGLGDAVKVTYMKLDGSDGYEYCHRSTSCTQSLRNAYYYVSYQRVQHSASQRLYYKRSQELNDEFTNCSSRMIPYYPAKPTGLPYNIEKSTRYCRNQEENEKQIHIVLAVVLILAFFFLIVVIILLAKTECCGFCPRNRHATITDSLMNNADSTYQPRAYPPPIDYGAQPSPYQQPGQGWQPNFHQQGPDQNRVYV